MLAVANYFFNNLQEGSEDVLQDNGCFCEGTVGSKKTLHLSAGK